MASRIIRLKIDGMTCMNCAGAVVNAVASLSGIKNPKVHLEDQAVVLELDEERTSKDEVVAAYQQSGMSAAAFATHCGVKYPTLASWVAKAKVRLRQLWRG